MDSKLATLSRSTGMGVWKGWCVVERHSCPEYIKIKKTRGPAIAIAFVISAATADAAIAVADAAAMPSLFQHIKET